MYYIQSGIEGATTQFVQMLGKCMAFMLPLLYLTSTIESAVQSKTFVTDNRLKHKLTSTTAASATTDSITLCGRRR